MTEPNSPIIDFYPQTFEMDMNGKKSEWEAIVKIPFIDQKRLLSSISARAALLSSEERHRNEFGSAFKFNHFKGSNFYASSHPSFPDIAQCHCQMVPFTMPELGPIKQTNLLCKNVLLGSKLLPGFCSLATIPFTASLGFHGVTVFSAESKYCLLIEGMKPSFCHSKTNMTTVHRNLLQPI
jgi:5'-3' exonuclease